MVLFLPATDVSDTDVSCQLGSWSRNKAEANQQKAFHVSEKSVFVSTGFVYHSSLTGSF